MPDQLQKYLLTEKFVEPFIQYYSLSVRCDARLAGTSHRAGHAGGREEDVQIRGTDSGRGAALEGLP